MIGILICVHVNWLGDECMFHQCLLLVNNTQQINFVMSMHVCKYNVCMLYFDFANFNCVSP